MVEVAVRQDDRLGSGALAESLLSRLDDVVGTAGNAGVNQDPAILCAPQIEVDEQVSHPDEIGSDIIDSGG